MSTSSPNGSMVALLTPSTPSPTPAIPPTHRINRRPTGRGGAGNFIATNPKPLTSTSISLPNISPNDPDRPRQFLIMARKNTQELGNIYFGKHVVTENGVVRRKLSGEALEAARRNEKGFGDKSKEWLTERLKREKPNAEQERSSKSLTSKGKNWLSNTFSKK